MFKQRRLLLAMSAAAGGLAAAAAALVAPALAHADPDGVVDLSGLTLVSAGHEEPYTALGPDGYVGFQPFFTEWQQYQPTSVDIDGSSVGSYNVFESDYATKWTDESVYDFGTATSGGTDPGGLAGATVTDFALDPSFNAATEKEPPADVTAALDNLHVVFGNGVVDNLLTTASGTYFSVDDPGVGSALWFEGAGSSDPSLIWSGLADTASALASVEDLASLLPPDVWFPGI
jgi:hypothetical protein